MRNRDYTCEICGQHGGNLNVHHIKPFSLILDEFLHSVYTGNIQDFVHEILQYKDFTSQTNLILVCEKCHREIHYTDNPDLSPYRWERATTIESINNKPIIIEEASRVDSSESKCRDT